ncbi:MAG: prolyl oligopeptidase family serine peptidase [Planctomycetes bacterium]|nr:prolyl oligopeptidase family serine peptidase [Planctomycetota bacterium]
MTKQTENWHSERLGRQIKVCRWGVMGTPVLLFPTAGGDAEEIERFWMIDVLEPLIAAQRIKVYSCDSTAGQALLGESNQADFAARAQQKFDAFVYHELVPLIRQDCRDPGIEVVTAGASIGAYQALAAVCRHPDVFKLAVCMSGTYDLAKFMDGEPTSDHHFNTPTRFLRDMSEGPHLERLRQRFVLLTHGQGKAEEPEQSWRVADVLGRRNVPNRVVEWGPEWPHDWTTWRKMLPLYLDEYVR